MPIPFERAFAQPHDTVVNVTPRIRRLLVRNPSPFTFKGTGVTIVGHGHVAVIDPGPDDPHNLAVLREALRNETVTHILITHTHRDHSPAARALKQWTGATVYGYGPHGGGKAEEGVVVEEGGDMDFLPDIAVRDLDVIKGRDFTFECIHTPGHTSNHVCYAFKEENALFSGDHVMGWSTTVVAPPDGDMAQYMASLKKLLARDESVYWPTHGGPIQDPKPFVRAYLEHRYEREAQILASLRDGAALIQDIVLRIYVGLDPALRPAASLSVLAHLIKLVREGRVIASGGPRLDAAFALARRR
jgi:glyoxylase-like metal-dependent hydrolase (beta-lactamase superfamily II)